MSSNQDNNPHVPPLQIDNEKLASTIARALSKVNTCERCSEYAVSFTRDFAILRTEIERLHAEVIRERLVSANLRAAIRAALAAHAEGEDDPLAYLRYELPDDDSTGVDWGWQ
jgi:hypothetical protein